jgi:dienelactone hydrolase
VHCHHPPNGYDRLLGSGGSCAAAESWQDESERQEMNSKSYGSQMVAVATAAALTGAAWAEPAPLVDREFFFGVPQRTMPRLSMDEKRLAYIAPHKGVPSLWVRTLGQSDDRLYSEESDLAVGLVAWTINGKYLVFERDTEVAGNRHVFQVPAEGGTVTNLTPFREADTRIVKMLFSRPNTVAILSNNFDLRNYQLLAGDVAKGALDWVGNGDTGLTEWTFNEEGELRWAAQYAEDGRKQVLSRLTLTDQWRPFLQWSPGDALVSRLVDFAGGGEGFYVISSTGTSSAGLRGVSWRTAEQIVIARDEAFDVVDVLLHPVKRIAEAVALRKERLTWQALDEGVKGDLERLSALADGEYRIVDRQLLDRNWLIQYRTVDGPNRYYIYNRASQKCDPLFAEREVPENFKAGPTKRVTFEAREGLKLFGYLTRPVEAGEKKLPLILFIPDGLWEPNDDLYDPTAQWLANRGYAVLKVDPRGTVGRGKEFIEAGVKEWGGAMIRDLLDGVAWAVKEGVADPAKVAVLGKGMGGFAALAAMAAGPEVFCCGAGVGGPTDLTTFLKRNDTRLMPILPQLRYRIGDPEKDAEMLKKQSPIHSVSQITRPVYLAHWAEDKKVHVAESQRMAIALEQAGKKVKYTEFEGACPGPKNEDLLRMHAELEAFFAEHVGGRMQPSEEKIESESPE